MAGNPYTLCQEEPRSECREDSDCPLQLACLNKKCQNPCYVLAPCDKPATCEVISTLPVRTMICVCPSGYISSGSGTCKTVPSVTDVACTTDSQCPSDRACINGICINPCNCGPNAECHVKNNKPICVCVAGYEGNPNLNCVPGTVLMTYYYGIYEMLRERKLILYITYFSWLSKWFWLSRSGCLSKPNLYTSLCHWWFILRYWCYLLWYSTPSCVRVPSRSSRQSADRMHINRV